MTPMTGTSSFSRNVPSAAAAALLHATTSAFTSWPSNTSVISSACASTSGWGLGPYGNRPVSPKYTVRSSGKRSISARRTVRPPSPESNTPIGRSFIETRSSRACSSPEPIRHCGAEARFGRRHREHDVEGALIGGPQHAVQLACVPDRVDGRAERNRPRICRGRTHHADPLTAGERRIDARADLARVNQLDARGGRVVRRQRSGRPHPSIAPVAVTQHGYVDAEQRLDRAPG